MIGSVTVEYNRKSKHNDVNSFLWKMRFYRVFIKDSEPINNDGLPKTSYTY